MTRSRGHVPIRTCVSCRERREKKDLVRLSITKEGIIAANRPEGRGVYLCRNNECKDLLKKDKKLSRLFRTEKEISISPDLFKELL